MKVKNLLSTARIPGKEERVKEGVKEGEKKAESAEETRSCGRHLKGG